MNDETILTFVEIYHDTNEFGEEIEKGIFGIERFDSFSDARKYARNLDENKYRNIKFYKLYEIWTDE